MARVPETDKQTIREMYADGKEMKEIAQIMSLEYKDIYIIVREKQIKESNASYYRKNHGNKNKLPPASKFVETSKEMPPVYKSELLIIADKNLAEQACSDMGLKPPVCPLAKRPSSFNANGWVWTGTGWVAGTDVNNVGRVKHKSAGSML